MEMVLAAILALLNALGPTLSTTAVGHFIELLTSLLPVVVKAGIALKPIVMDIIGLLKQQDKITPEQIAQLEATSDQYNTEFEMAASAAIAEDEAADAAEDAAAATKPSA